MLQLSNEMLQVAIAEKGAELQGLFRKDLDIEYLWSGDPAVWGKKSPVLFPIIGGLKNNSYQYNGKTYTLGRHGFARERVFTVTEQEKDHIVFQLTDDKETWKVYPFHFRFSVRYSLQEDKLAVDYIVENTGEEDLLFSVGGHPAFKVPLLPGTSYEDYYLEFQVAEQAGRWPLSGDGLIERTPEPLLEETQVLPLSKPLFYKDALVFKQLLSTTVDLKTDLEQHGLEFHFSGFPYLGIWAAKDADFVCIEPWCGIADHVDVTGRLEEKDGIERLAPGKRFNREWTVRCY